MPTPDRDDQTLLYISTCSKATLATLAGQNKRHPFPLDSSIRLIVRHRLAFAGGHLQTADGLLSDGEYRSAISRYYYAMYHAARAVAFGHHRGDDHQHHGELPRHLPPSLEGVQAREQELVDARFLRNCADYDIYPRELAQWAPEAQRLSATAPYFVSCCQALEQD